jgi:nucleolar protein 14
MAKVPANFPYHEPKFDSRLDALPEQKTRMLTLMDCSIQDLSPEEETELKAALLETSIKLFDVAADVWTEKSGFPETFSPALKVLKHLGSKACREHLPRSTTVRLNYLLYSFPFLPICFSFLNQHGCQITIRSFL